MLLFILYMLRDDNIGLDGLPGGFSLETNWVEPYEIFLLWVGISSGVVLVSVLFR